MTRRHFLALATLTLLVAAFLRIWQLASYPPGPHYDEAAELLMTRSIAFGGARFFPMVEAYQGREVLFYYLAAPFLSLINDGIFSLRVVSVFCGMLTIAASMALGRAMFGGQRGAVVGLVVGVLMTLSFPLLWMARQAFRSSALPLMQALALLLLWRALRVGWTKRNIVLLAFGGFFAGAALYTYNSSRLFPLWLMIAGVALLAFDRANWRLRLKQGAVFFGMLAVTAVPMALYAVQRPDVFWGRLAEVTQPGQSITLAESIILHLKMFFLSGDPYFRYNEPGRPYVTFPEGLLLLIGIAVAAYRLTRRNQPAIERAAYLLALLSPLMVIPSVISVGGLPPSHMRSLGMVPLIFVLAAVGAESILSGIQHWFNHRDPLSGSHSFRSGGFKLVAAIIVIPLLVGAILVSNLYFHWAGRAELFYETDADLSAAAQWLVAQQVEAGTPVYLAARDKGHPTVMIESVPSVTWLGTDSLFRPPPGETGLYIFPHSAPVPPKWESWLAPGEIDGLPLAPDGQPAFRAFRVSGDAPLPVAESDLDAHNRYLTFVGLDAPPLTAGESGTISMAWHIDSPPPFDDLTPLITLEAPTGSETSAGSLIFRGDAYMAGTASWRAGETLIQRLAVNIPPATPPGEYILRAAWIERSSDSYVSYLGEDGAQGAVWAQIGTLEVTRPTASPDPETLAIGTRYDAEIADGVILLGWDAPPASLRPGEALPITLYWQAAGAARPPFTLRAILRDEQGETVLWTGQPIDDRYTADQWAEGEVLADRVRWTIPRQQPAGEYTLVLSIGENEVEISALRIEGVARIFQPPEVTQRVDANFAGQLSLYGVTAEQSSDSLSVRLVWQALEAPARDYKVFVHLVDANGGILAQRDAMPQGDTYPTRLWLPGEFVPDSYELPLLDGAVALRIGLYAPDDGARLNVVDEGGKTTGNFVEIVL